jgi:hypothetical protein
MRRAVYTTFVAVFAVGGTLAAAACGGTTTAVPDAPSGDAPAPPDAGGDAMPLACAELTSPELTITALPTHVSGDLASTGADLIAPPQCATDDDPFGEQTAGNDEVIAVDGLTPGTDYVVRLVGSADLSFYVITGCSVPTGPANRDCLLYEDKTTSGAEVGHFVAPDAPVWIVVDYYASQPPTDGTWSLDVYASQCTSDAQCGGTTPSCLDGRCVGCSSSFDCADPAKPVCDTSTHVCGAGTGGCTGDDSMPPENGDDGPAGARVLVPDAQGRTTTTGHICNTPSSERDYFAFTVAQPGDDWEVQLSWSTTADLDLAVYDHDGATMGLSYYETPEDILLTYLPGGTYYVAVSQYAQQPVAQSTAYTLRTARAGDACASSADCAAEYRNQIYRGDCSGGACVPIAGGGALAPGDACDRVSDCATGSSCASFFFTANADTRDVCGTYCTHDSDCSGMGAGFVCTTYLQQNFCVEKCTADAQCPVSVSTAPSTPPWARLRCDKPTGHCAP